MPYFFGVLLYAHTFLGRWYCFLTVDGYLADIST